MTLISFCLGTLEKLTNLHLGRKLLTRTYLTYILTKLTRKGETYKTYNE